MANASLMYISSLLEPYCNVLPGSNNGENFEKGCPGAVFANGNPAKEYCDSKPWYKDCCTWEEGKCVAEEIGKKQLFVFYNAA